MTDGHLTQGGWYAGHGVGWYRDPGELAVVFDLGQTRNVSRARIYTHGGSDSAVNWPLNASVLLSPDVARVAPEGAGAATPGFAALAGGDPVITGKYGPWCTPDDGFAHCTDLDGYLEVSPPRPISARYLTFFTEADGEVLLDQAQIEADGAMLSNVPYTLRTYPTPAAPPAYADDARRLTDGVIATSYLGALVSGWPAATDVQVDLSLPAAGAALREVTVWSQSIGALGIDAPASVRVEASSDGSAFTSLGEVPAANAVALDAARGYRITLATPLAARRLRITVPAHGASDHWTMLSEIEAR